MSNQTAVPAGMIPIDGKLVKRVKLSVSQQIDNFMFKFTPIAMVFIASGWTLILWYKAWQRWHKKHPGDWFRPELPRKLTVITIGMEHPTIKRMLKDDYHINYLFLNYEWVIVKNVICMRGEYLVSKFMHDKADSILYHSGIQSELWHCEHQPGALRHVQFRPHAQAAQRKPPPARPRQARLGRTYR